MLSEFITVRVLNLPMIWMEKYIDVEDYIDNLLSHMEVICKNEHGE